MEIIRLTPDNLSQAAHTAAKVLSAGGIVVYPTDTVYGLAVNALDPEALVRLREFKGREQKRPIAVVVPGIPGIEACGTLTPSARALAEKYLPGPLTLIVPAHENIPEDLTLNGGIGVRVPNDPFCHALADAFGHPYTTTSANFAGLATPKDVIELMWHFGAHISSVALIIDDGERAGGTPSTVVSCLEETPVVIRVGKLSKEELGL